MIDTHIQRVSQERGLKVWIHIEFVFTYIYVSPKAGKDKSLCLNMFILLCGGLSILPQMHSSQYKEKKTRKLIWLAAFPLSPVEGRGESR